MDKVRSFFQRFVFTEKSAPLAFLVTCIFSFGLLIPSLGFYMDDWPYVFYAKLKGIDSLREMLIFDSRPNAAWLYMLGFNLLGFKPMAWHIAALLMRWGTVILIWMIFKSLWPERKKEAVTIGLFFAVYPFFMLQPFAVGSTHHWFGFLAFTLSILLMIHAVKTGSGKMLALTALALVLEAAHLFTSEYFSGLELIRIFILWILISRAEPAFSKRLTKVLLNWLPYLIVLGIFFYWRVAVYENPPDVVRNEPVIFQQLLSEPFKAIGYLIATSIKDALAVMTIGWQKATDVSLLNFTSPFVQFRLGMSVLFFGVVYFYLSKFLSSSAESKDDWKTGSITLAVAGLLTGGLPVWLIGRSIVESKNLLSASRFGIPAMFGAAILSYWVIDYFVKENTKKLLLLAFMLALSVNFHLDNTKEFQYSWEKQVRLAQQLLWRAPRVEPGTTFLTDEEVLGVMGEYAVSFSINTTYQEKNIENIPPYWYFPFYYTNPDINALLQGAPLEYSKLSMDFAGSSKKMILLSFNPELKRCLWVMQPQDVNLRLVSDDMRQLSAGSDINLIKRAEGEDPTLPEDIYGKQSKQTWCYFFEKADLARQYGQWDEVVRLWEESQSTGERADDGFEYIPFIEGLGHTGDWEQVKSLTKFSKKITAGLEPSLCSALNRLAVSAPASQERDDMIFNLKEDLKCSEFE
ncbi:MAG: hypothetical protein IPO22_08360 [Anaerolineales bacterium]|nr:hypothetical protein [Anaerolineales bacterium]